MYFFLVKKLNPSSISIWLPDVTVAEEKLKSVESYDITCGSLGFPNDSLENYIIFSNSNKPFGKKISIDLTREESTKINSALLTVLSQHPPQYNPNINICWNNESKIIYIYPTKVDGQIFVLKTNNSFDLQQKIVVEIKGNKISGVTPIAYTKDNHFYFEIPVRAIKDNAPFIYLTKINFSSSSFEISGQGYSSNTQRQPSLDYDPVSQNIYSNKNIVLGYADMFTGSNNPLSSLNKTNLIDGYCTPYMYDPNNNIYNSLDNIHPRYGGRGSTQIDADKSQKIMQILKEANFQSQNNIFYCLVGQNQILTALPSKQRHDREVLVVLLDQSINKNGEVKLSLPAYSTLSSFDPVAFTKENVFYLKLSGELSEGPVNLFKIDFNNNSYQTLYKGK